MVGLPDRLSHGPAPNWALRLRELNVEAVWPSGFAPGKVCFLALLAALAGATLPTLQALRVRGSATASWQHLAAALGRAEWTRQLTELYVENVKAVGHVGFAGLRLDRLQELEIHDAELNVKHVRELARAPWLGQVGRVALLEERPLYVRPGASLLPLLADPHALLAMLNPHWYGKRRKRTVRTARGPFLLYR